MITHNLSTIKKIKLGIKYSQTAFNYIIDYALKKININKRLKFPRVINVFATNACNLNCSMCVYSNFRRGNLTKSEMTYEITEQILPELVRYKPIVAIIGGEPLINTKIFKIIKLLSKNKIITTLITNGLLLEKNVDNIIESKLEFITVSLDHYDPKIHDEIRGLDGTFNMVINGLKKLISKKNSTPSNIKICTTITRKNYSDLNRIYDFVESLEVDEWLIGHYSFLTPEANKKIHQYRNTTGFGSFVNGDCIRNNHYLTKNQVVTLISQINSILTKSNKYKTKLSINPEIDDIYSYYSDTFPSTKSTCSTPFDSVTILNNSKLTLCMGYEVGDIKKNQTIKEVWDSKLVQEFHKLIKKNKVLPPCFRCCSLKFKFK